MSRRRSTPDPAKAVFAAFAFVFIACAASPQIRTVVVGLLIIAAVAGIIYVVYRRCFGRTKSHDLHDILVAAPAAKPLVPEPVAPRYVTRKSVLSPAEIAFHKVLLQAVPEAPVFPKVRVADVMDAAERFSGDFLRISQKHFDWVLCHPESFEPLVAIELDDASHQWSHKQRKNDQVKDDAAREAGITLLRFPWQHSYDVEVIRARLATELDRIADAKERK